MANIHMLLPLTVYKTLPLQQALQKVFGSNAFYGSPQEESHDSNTKVAVVTASTSNPVVLANYSRRTDVTSDYVFELPHDFKTWEAAYATSAAPSYFRPFVSSTNRTYLDGGLYANNPVAIADDERRAIWPDVAEESPDLLLSIGTGKVKIESEVSKGTEILINTPCWNQAYQN